MDHRVLAAPPPRRAAPPLLPKKALTPGEMWGVLLGASGYVPLPPTEADYTELLPVRFHPITDRGIRINYRTYDHVALNEHRGRPSPTGPGGKWEVHLNPHDVRQTYISPARRTPARDPVDPPRPCPRAHAMLSSPIKTSGAPARTST